MDKLIFFEQVVQRRLHIRIQIDFIVRLNLLQLPLLRFGFGQKGKRLGGADGKGVNPALSLAFHQQDDALDDRISHFIGQIRLVDHHIIADLIDCKRATVSVQHLSARCIDALGTRVVSLCHLPVFFCIHNLIFHQPQRKNDKHRDDDTDQQKNPALVLLLFFHGIASFLLLLQFLLKKAVHPPYRQKNQRSDQQGTQQIGEHMPQQNLGAVFISPHSIVKKVFQ